MLRRIFAARYSTDQAAIDFLSSDTKIKAIPSGRLSFVFTARQGECEVFLKIVKPGLVHNNIPFSVMCTEQCRLHSDIPTFQTYIGKDGKLFQQVPAYLDGVDQVALDVFKDQYMSLTQAAPYGIDEIPEKLKDIPGGRSGQLALMEKLGEYVVDVSCAVIPLVKGFSESDCEAVDTSDPAGFKKNRTVLREVFQLQEEYMQAHALGADKHIAKLAENLRDDPVSLSFKKGLLQGDLIFIIQRFNCLQDLIEKSLKRNPAENVPIHNEVKPANIGAVYNKETDQWKITQSFDFDNIAWGNKTNGDATPIEKDLGRTISFFAFDPGRGDFLAENAFAVCKGFLKRLGRKLSAAEIGRLIYYIQFGVVTSYLWRSSYFADELHGKVSDIELDRLDPSIHVEQLKAFDLWLSRHDFTIELEKNG